MPARALLAGRQVLVVDESAADGAALGRAVAELRMLGAAEVRTLVLFSGLNGAKTDYTGHEVTGTIRPPWMRDIAMVDAMRT